MDDWITKNRPGAFQHASFGKNDGWFLAIQMANLFATLTGALAVGAFLRGFGAHVGGGLSGGTALDVLVCGVWLYGLMNFRRWAIRALPVVCWLLLGMGLLVAAMSFFAPQRDILSVDRSPELFPGICALLCMLLSGVALWRMQHPLWKEYHRSARGT